MRTELLSEHEAKEFLELKELSEHCQQKDFLEMLKRSIYTKGMITDIPSHVNERDVSNVEMQVFAQNFICQRMEIYAAEYIISQYTKEKEKNKNLSGFNGRIDAQNIGDVYMCALMKESPKLFKDNPDFLHRSRTITDSGIEIPDISHIVYDELDKAKKLYLNKGYTKKNREACFLMAFIADVNMPQIRREAEQIPFYKSILGDIRTMGYDRKEMLSMLAEKYADLAMDLYKLQWMEEGREEGIEKGREEGKYNAVDVMVRDFGIDTEKACNSIGIDYERYMKYKQLQEMESLSKTVKEQTVSGRPVKKR